MKNTTAPPLSKFFALLIVWMVPSIASAQVPQFDSFYVFGDSLADNGNILIQTDAMGMEPPVPPSATPHRMYYGGRFSNGFVGFEYLWQRLTGHRPESPHGLKPFLAAPFTQKPGAINFAFGGTGTPYVDKTPGGFSAPGLKGQVELFRLALRGKKPSSRALYAVATGANDYRLDAFNEPMSPEDVVRNIADAIVSLYKLGARDVLVVDLPNLARIPANLGNGDAALLSAYHNFLLDGALAQLGLQYPLLHLIPVKLDPLFDDLEFNRSMDAQNPLIAEYFPMAPYMAACLFINPVICTDAPSILFNTKHGSIFWDIVHPTTEAHEFLGKYMYQQLEAEY